MAVVEPLAGIDVERRRPLLVERAAPHPLRSGLAELRVGPDEFDDVGPLLHSLEGCRCQPPAHGPRLASGSSSSRSGAARSDRSMPATWSVTRVARSIGGSPSSMSPGCSQKWREQAAHDEPGAVGLGPVTALAVDALEQERPQCQHGLRHRLALADVSGGHRRSRPGRARSRRCAPSRSRRASQPEPPAVRRHPARRS